MPYRKQHNLNTDSGGLKGCAGATALIHVLVLTHLLALCLMDDMMVHCGAR